MDYKKVTPTAYHEAGHFIVYLVNCKRNIAFPDIREISLQPIHKKHIAYMSRKMFPPEFYQELINSDLPEAYKEYQISIVRDEIKTLLAGIASEFVYMGIDQTKQSLTGILNRFYKLDRKFVNSDENVAIAYSVAIGNQKQNDGVAPLLEMFEEVIQDVKTYWDEIKNLATLLEDKIVINGPVLDSLCDEIYERIEVKVNDIFLNNQ